MTWAPVTYHIADDEDRDGLQNVGLFYTYYVADCPRRLYLIYVADKPSINMVTNNTLSARLTKVF
jgi:hypothetical protein